MFSSPVTDWVLYCTLLNPFEASFFTKGYLVYGAGSALVLQADGFYDLIVQARECLLQFSRACKSAFAQAY